MTKDPTSEIIKESAKGVIADLYVGIKTWFKSTDPDGAKYREYTMSISTHLGVIQIMSMPAPRPLEQIYVGLSATENLKKYTRPTPDMDPSRLHNIAEAQKFIRYRQTIDINNFLDDLGFDIKDADAISENVIGRKWWASSTRAEIENSSDARVAFRAEEVVDFINREDHVIILGQPGSGKTTLLKYLALVFSGNLSTKSPIAPFVPIFVPLREHSRAGSARPTSEWLKNLILSSASDLCSRKYISEWLDAAIEAGKCIILLDGVDEISAEDIAAVYHSIRAFSAKYQNKIIITCRVASFTRGIEGFTICEIDDFNDDDKEAFVNQWFGRNNPDSKRLLSDISASRLANDLCKTPLLLTLICVLYGYRRRIPANRAELYEACVDALLFRWDTYRSIDRTSYLPIEISPEKKKNLLARIAQKTFRNNLIYFPHSDLRDLITAELNHLDIASTTATDFIKEIESNNGLFIEYTVGVYCFSHLTFHEFFVACYYYDTKEEDELFSYAIKNPRYLEILMMYIEKSYNCGHIVMSIISYVNNSCLQKSRYNNYTHLIVQELLANGTGLHKKLTAALRECDVRLTQLDIEGC